LIELGRVVLGLVIVSGLGVQSLPRLQIIVVRNVRPTALLVVAVADVFLPRHSFLARWFNNSCEVTANVSRSIVHGSILWPTIPKMMREKVGALQCRIEISARQISRSG